MKSVFLKCRFGDHLPNAHKPVLLPIESADYLIAEGLAEESVEVAVVDTKELEKVNGELATKVAELEKVNGELATKVAELQVLVDAVNAAPAKGK